MIDVDLGRRVPGFDLAVAFRNDRGITGLFGPSGSGKSMVLGLIAGLERPDRGHVRIGDTILVDTATSSYVPMHRRRIGLVFQDSHLFPHFTVRRNLGFGRWFAPRAERPVDFDAVVETLGIGALLGRRPGALSGGERQRVAIGRALLSCPRLLLFDEPFAALDRERKLEILPLIERLRDTFGIPIVYVSHAVEEMVRLAAHVVVLRAGHVVAQGAPGEVFGAGEAVGDRRFGRVSVLDVTIGPEDKAYGLTALHHPAGTLWLAATGRVAGASTRALVRATDVSLAAALPGPTTIRSALVGTIARIEADGPLAAIEIILAGGGTLAALVTRRAVADLDLRVGAAVHALIKTVALDEGAVAPGRAVE